jgi:hypothetical protein
MESPTNLKSRLAHPRIDRWNQSTGCWRFGFVQDYDPKPSDSCPRCSTVRACATKQELVFLSGGEESLHQLQLLEMIRERAGERAGRRVPGVILTRSLCAVHAPAHIYSTIFLPKGRASDAARSCTSVHRFG